MNSSFEFGTTSRIVFGVGAVEQLPQITLAFGRRVLAVIGSKPERTAPIVSAIEDAGGCVSTLPVHREPNVADIAAGIEQLREHRADVVLAIGGGSVIDAAKALAAVSGNEGELEDYLEIVGRGQTLSRPGVPCIAVPTTAGTGAEVTRNAVIDASEHDTKVSLRSSHLLPRVALLDPQLTLTVSPRVTAETGFDALAQVIEPYVSNRANPMTDALALAAIRRAAGALRRAYFVGHDLTARTDMALVSLWGGMCLANARLGAVHGLAGPLGGMFHAPHGALCAALLGPVMRANIEALRRPTDASGTLARFDEIARLLTGDASARAEDGAHFVEQLASELGIRTLTQLGVPTAKHAEVIPRAMRASSMQGNPLPLAADQIAAILANAR